MSPKVTFLETFVKFKIYSYEYGHQIWRFQWPSCKTLTDFHLIDLQKSNRCKVIKMSGRCEYVCVYQITIIQNQQLLRRRSEQTITFWIILRFGRCRRTERKCRWTADMCRYPVEFSCPNERYYLQYFRWYFYIAVPRLIYEAAWNRLLQTNH